jgi:hypothetical protein
MQTPTFPAQQSRSAANSFFATHPIGEIARSFFVSSIGWVLMAVVVYAVYSMVLGGH